MKKRKLVILSLDAMITEDVEYLLDRPFVQKFIKEGVWIKSLRTVYPANTYPCHASMITGAYPSKTGVDTNYYDGTTDWRVERNNIKIKTLIDYAKEEGLTTANVYWPVLVGDENIDYNIAEFPDVWDGLIPLLKSAGATDEVIKEIVEPNLYILDDLKDKNLHADGRFIFACARDILLKYQPDILLVHPCPLDSQRHRDGVFSDGVTNALELCFNWVQELYDTVKEIGEEDNTDFVWMSDHGQITINKWYRFLVELKNTGLIDADQDGKPIPKAVDTKVFNNSLKIKVLDDSVYDKLVAIMDDAVKNNKGIKVFTNKDAKTILHTVGDFDFIIDTDGTCGIGKEAIVDDFGSIYSTYAPGVNKNVGTHGFSPDVGYQPTLLALGPDFKSGVILNRIETVDVPVTLAKCLGLKLENADGKVIEEILK